jgi:hypothetical protein
MSKCSIPIGLNNNGKSPMDSDMSDPAEMIFTDSTILLNRFGMLCIKSIIVKKLESKSILFGDTRTTK